MKGKLARSLIVLVVVALVLMSFAPMAVLARPPKPGLDEAEQLRIENLTRDMTPEQLRAFLKANALQVRKEPGGPNPRAAARLAASEAHLVATGRSPRAAGLGLAGPAKLLVIPVEFTGSQDFSECANEDCTVTQTVTIEGPLHNRMPNPADVGDNQTFWVSDFSSELYTHLFFDTGPTGGVGVIRRDLNGGSGVDLSGLTAANYYLEQSRGAYRLTGKVLPWIPLPVSEGEYGANTPGGDDGLRGPVWRIARDACAKVKELYPGLNWGEFDVDRDGVIDHLVIIHAGADESAGGGAQGPYAIWAHSWDIQGGGYVVDDRGTPDTADDIRAVNYTIVPENADVGVIVHEFGHDIGLPDLYSADASNSSGFWDVMSSGSWAGALGGVQPSSINLWGRIMLGWADPVVVDVTSPETTVTVGQLAGQKPQGTADGVIMRLPPQIVPVAAPTSGTHLWWSNDDKANGDTRIWRQIDLTEITGPLTFAFKANYRIEEDWDFAFVEASDDGGATWVQLPEIGGHTTPDDYADPHGRLAEYGGLKHGITGDSEGWVELTFSLSEYVGGQVLLRLRYITDAAFQERGMFVDDLAMRAGESVLFFDDVETGPNGWTKDDTTLDGSQPGAGWRIEDGVFTYPQYYLLEWRSMAGFDRGLEHAYQHYWFGPGGDKVDRTPYTMPGALLWYRNFRYRSNMTMMPYVYDPPSYGAKGALLVVDSHPEPLRFPSVEGSPMAGRTLGGRGQTANSVFGLNPTTGYQLTTSEWWYDYVYGEGTMTETGKLFTGPVPSEPPVSEFHDSLGYYPGVLGKAFVDWDASVVLPAKALYWPKWVPYGSAGNPGLGAYGLHFAVVDQAPDGSWGKVRVYNNGDTFLGQKLVDRTRARKGDVVTVTIILKDSAGTRYDDDAPHAYEVNLADPVPAGCSVVPGSITGGAEFVRDNPHEGNADTGQVVWRGTVGGKPLSEPDAVITYRLLVNMDAPVGRAMLSSAMVKVGPAGPTGHLPRQALYTLAQTITVAPQAVALPVVMR